MRHTTELPGHTLADLEQACANLRLLGAASDTEVRVRTSATFSVDGGLPKTITGRWNTPKPVDDNRPGPEISIAAPDARPMFRDGPRQA